MKNGKKGRGRYGDKQEGKWKLAGRNRKEKETVKEKKSVGETQNDLETKS